MRAVVVLARTVLRTSLVRTALLVVVLAVSIGFALFSATAARRTATAFDRFVVWAETGHASTGGVAGEVPPTEYFDEITALPSVVDARVSWGIGITGAEIDGRLIEPSRFSAGAVDELDAGFDRALVLEGSIPEVPTAEQGIVDFVTSRQLGVDVGDEVTLLVAVDHDDTVVDVPIEVVAVISSPSSIPTVAGYQFNGIGMGPAFLEEHPDFVDPFASGLVLRLRDGVDSVDDLRREMEAAGIGEIDVQDLGTIEVGAERLFTLEATTMWVAAVLALLVGLPVVYQLVRRDAGASRSSVEIALSIGASRRQVALAAAARTGTLALVAIALGTVAAVLCSPLSPVGLARSSEVDRGLYVDAAVVAVMLPSFLVVVVLIGVLGTLRGALSSSGFVRSATPARSRQPRVPVAVGVRMATGSGGGAAVAGIGALVFVSLLVVGIAVTASSLETLPDDPEVSGGVWDGFMVLDPTARDEVEDALAAQPEVVRYGRGGWMEMEASDEPIVTLYLPDGMDPAMASGRAPRADDEVALGAATMRRLGVRVGDALPVSFPGYDVSPRRLTVTGETITASPLFQTHAPDDGAVVAFDVPPPTESDGSEPLLLRFAPGGDPQAILEEVVAEMPDGAVWFSFARGRRGDVIALEELEGLIRAMLLMTALLAAASLVHQVLVTHRRTASEIGVLRAIGFTSGNVAETGATHGGVLAGITALVAVPVGVAAGSTAWRYLAGELVVLPRTRYDLASMVGAAIPGLLAAAAVGALLAHRSARRPVAEALRAE